MRVLVLCSARTRFSSAPADCKFSVRKGCAQSVVWQQFGLRIGQIDLKNNVLRSESPCRCDAANPGGACGMLPPPPLSAQKTQGTWMRDRVVHMKNSQNTRYVCHATCKRGPLLSLRAGMRSLHRAS